MSTALQHVRRMRGNDRRIAGPLCSSSDGHEMATRFMITDEHQGFVLARTPCSSLKAIKNYKCHVGVTRYTRGQLIINLSRMNGRNSDRLKNSDFTAGPPRRRSMTIFYLHICLGAGIMPRTRVITPTRQSPGELVRNTWPQKRPNLCMVPSY